MTNALPENIWTFWSTNKRAGLKRLVHDLTSAIENEFQKCPAPELHVESPRIAQVVFVDDFLSNKKSISSLYNLVENPRRFSSPPDPNLASAFSRHVTTKSFNILAIFLLAGDEFLLKNWEVLLRHLGMWKDPGPAKNDALGDANLPIPFERLVPVFGHEHAQLFDKFQHKFCQLDRQELEPDFEDTRDAIWRDIKAKAMFKCVRKNENGEILDESPGDSWHPKANLNKVYDDSQDLLRVLFFASEHAERKHRNEMLPEDPWLLRKLYDKIQAKANCFLSHLRPRWKILAILIKIKIDPRCITWRRFRDLCLTGSSDPLTSLPISFRDLTNLDFVDEDRRDTFFHAQFSFSPIRLKPNEVHCLEDFEEIRLPLLSQEWLGKGGSGEVYKVEVAKGYFDPETATRLAMKVIDANAGRDYMEWHSADRLKNQLFESKGLIMPLASVRTKSKIYLFMELADCDLTTFMRKTPGPQTFSQRRMHLINMLDIARSLQHLHKDLWANDEGLEGRREALIHGDIKAGNILYTSLDRFGNPLKHSLRISDFGVSSFHYSAMESGEESARNRYSTPRLARGCPNFPPEAENEGRINFKSDIWGFGTVFLDFLAWISGGAAAFEQLSHARIRGYSLNDKFLYWTTKASGERILKPEIDEWFEKLINRTQCTEECEMYRGCWKLIKRVLLVCNAEQRGETEDVIRALSRILKHHPYSGPPSSSRHVDNSFVVQHVNEYAVPDTSEQQVHVEQVIARRSSVQSEKNKQFQSAVKQGRTEEAIKLSQAEDDIHMDDPFYETAFHFAVAYGNERLLKHLLDHHSHLLGHVNDFGETCLHACARRNSESGVRMAKLILERDTSISGIRDTNRATAFDWVRMNKAGDRKLLKLLNKYSIN